MKFFLDTANVEEIKKALEMGLVDGVTTNPTLLAKEKRDPNLTIKEILSLVRGPVNLEVLAIDAKGMIAEAKAALNAGRAGCGEDPHDRRGNEGGAGAS